MYNISTLQENNRKMTELTLKVCHLFFEIIHNYNSCIPSFKMSSGGGKKLRVILNFCYLFKLYSRDNLKGASTPPPECTSSDARLSYRLIGLNHNEYQPCFNMNIQETFKGRKIGGRGASIPYFSTNCN